MHLRWEDTPPYERCVAFIGDWFVAYLNNKDMSKVTLQQIEDFCVLAREQDLIWTSKLL